MVNSNVYTIALFNTWFVSICIWLHSVLVASIFSRIYSIQWYLWLYHQLLGTSFFRLELVGYYSLCYTWNHFLLCCWLWEIKMYVDIIKEIIYIWEIVKIQGKRILVLNSEYYSFSEPDGNWSQCLWTDVATRDSKRNSQFSRWVKQGGLPEQHWSPSDSHYVCCLSNGNPSGLQQSQWYLCVRDWLALAQWCVILDCWLGPVTFSSLIIICHIFCNFLK